MLTLRPELSNLDACEVRETPLTWRSTTGALAYLSLFIIVRRAKAKWPRPQGPVVQLMPHSDYIVWMRCTWHSPFHKWCMWYEPESDEASLTLCGGPPLLDTLYKVWLHSPGTGNMSQPLITRQAESWNTSHSTRYGISVIWLSSGETDSFEPE